MQSVTRQRVRAVQASRILLSLLVWVNLTLMCQGHNVHRQYIGPHLTLLDLLHGHHTPGEITEAGGMTDPAQHAEPEHMSPTGDSPEHPQASTPGANMLGAAYSAPAEAFSGTMLGLAFFMAWALRTGRLRAMAPAAVSALITQFVMRPEPPPPRRDLSILISG